MPISVDPDQGRRSVGPDLGPNCCKGVQETTKSSKKRVMSEISINRYTPSVRFVEHRQTVQNKTRRHKRGV